MIKDIIQDLFFDLIRKRHNLGTTDNIQFYLIKAFRRRLFQNLKKKNSSNNVDKSSQQPSIISSIEDALIYKEEITQRKQLVRQGLREISPKQREILFYRFTCNFEYSLICKVMSLKYDSARKQVFRAIKALKDKVSQKNGFQF
jgi:RNA polymerase sigma factor (sigma-70 family)